MSGQWYYSEDGAQYGPVDEAEIIRQIQDGELPISTPVLQEGHMDWQPARNHACFQVEIYPKKKKRPPVQATASTASKPASGGTSQLPSQTTAQPAVTPASPAVTTVIVKEKSVLPWVLAGVACIALVGVIFFMDREGDQPDIPPVVTLVTNTPPVPPLVTNRPPTPVTPTPVTPAPVTPTPAGAFVNTLGMKFVPVPGTEVSFCIWETRVKDYAAYAAANAGVDVSWKSPGFTQADTHPVVNVSWEDANAFCAWLTKKELAAGKITASQRYRLPTDAEWSVAVGLGKEKGNTPEAKDGGIKDVYPWGKERPPPVGAGNYSKSQKVDKFDYTSPVGSFASNKDGLHDMGGNVWEWCEDWYDPAAKAYRVLRGASWDYGAPGGLLSSARRDRTPVYRRDYVGFRCVLVGGSGG